MACRNFVAGVFEALEAANGKPLSSRLTLPIGIAYRVSTSHSIGGLRAGTVGGMRLYARYPCFRHRCRSISFCFHHRLQLKRRVDFDPAQSGSPLSVDFQLPFVFVETGAIEKLQAPIEVSASS